ncbi:hypothetical protein T439DRAFT_326115 [Meredithblackwellia eburnea MCA 4105]
MNPGRGINSRQPYGMNPPSASLYIGPPVSRPVEELVESSRKRREIYRFLYSEFSRYKLGMENAKEDVRLALQDEGAKIQWCAKLAGLITQINGVVLPSGTIKNSLEAFHLISSNGDDSALPSEFQDVNEFTTYVQAWWKTDPHNSQTNETEPGESRRLEMEGDLAPLAIKASGVNLVSIIERLHHFRRKITEKRAEYNTRLHRLHSELLNSEQSAQEQSASVTKLQEGRIHSVIKEAVTDYHTTLEHVAEDIRKASEQYSFRMHYAHNLEELQKLENQQAPENHLFQAPTHLNFQPVQVETPNPPSRADQQIETHPKTDIVQNHWYLNASKGRLESRGFDEHGNPGAYWVRYGPDSIGPSVRTQFDPDIQHHSLGVGVVRKGRAARTTRAEQLGMA